MLNNYASFLGLNPDTLLLRFADGLQTQLEARRASQPEQPKPIQVKETPAASSPLRRFLSADILIGGSVVLFLIVFIFWGVIRIFSMKSETAPTPTSPSIAEILLATSTPSETPTPQPATPTPPPQSGLFPTQFIATGTLEEGAEPPAESGAAVQVYITVLQRAWMRVLVDGNVEFEGRVIQGSAYPFIGDTQVEVLTGNGAALEVFFNGTNIGTMGDTGEIISLVFTSQGAFPPTPTITATPSPTLPVTSTPPAAQTPAPTAPENR